MFITDLAHALQQRTIRPLYAHTQATAKAGFLDPDWAKTVDIFPGMVLTRTQGDVYTLYTGAAGQKPTGLSALFIAPAYGIDELRLNTINAIAVWVGGNQAEFEILSPAFDTSADWTPNSDGSRKLLYVTKSAHAQGPGKLTPGTASDIGADAIAELIEVLSDTKIRISLNRQA